LSLQEALVTLLQLATNGGVVEPAEIESLCDEGIQVAQALEDEEKLGFFQRVKGGLTGLAPADAGS
jgi:hypothetical protein